MKHVKLISLLIVGLMACYGASKLQFQSPIVERTQLDNLILSRDIDANENDRFFAGLAGER